MARIIRIPKPWSRKTGTGADRHRKDFPQYCPDEGDKRDAYRKSIRGSVENLVRYVEMDLISAARQQLSDIAGYLDRLEELSKGGGQDAEDVEQARARGV